LDCGANGDCLFKVMALHFKNDPSKFQDCKKYLTNFVLQNLKNLKKSNLQLTNIEMTNLG